MNLIQKALLVLVMGIGSVFAASHDAPSHDEEEIKISRMSVSMSFGFGPVTETMALEKKDSSSSLQFSRLFLLREPRNQLIAVTDWASVFGKHPDDQVKKILLTIYESHSEALPGDGKFSYLYYVIGLEGNSEAWDQIKRLGAVPEEEMPDVLKDFKKDLDWMNDSKFLKDGNLCLIIDPKKLAEQK